MNRDLLLVVLAMTACEVDLGPEIARLDEHAECALAECSGDEICLDGGCVLKCKTDDDCPKGQVCWLDANGVGACFE